MTDDYEDSGSEYTRFQMTIQRGDGIDRRGDVTVEIQRERNPGDERETPVDLSLTSKEFDDDAVETTVNDAHFAEFYHEAVRATRVLEEQLGLEDDGE